MAVCWTDLAHCLEASVCYMRVSGPPAKIIAKCCLYNSQTIYNSFKDNEIWIKEAYRF